jgi:hypothetical protein
MIFLCNDKHFDINKNDTTDYSQQCVQNSKKENDKKFESDTFERSVTSKNSVISEIFEKNFCLNLHALENDGNFHNFLFWKSEHTSLFCMILFLFILKMIL